jgi:LacI family transcriptional regulator
MGMPTYRASEEEEAAGDLAQVERHVLAHHRRLVDGADAIRAEGPPERGQEAFGQGRVVLDTRSATRYLLSLGHRSIAYLAGPLSINTEPIRYSGYKRALTESGIDPEAQVYLQGDYSFEKARILVTELMGSSRHVTAIFASNDFMALGAREALSELEIRVPEDVSLMGFDDVPFSALLSLTTISQPAFDLGKNALILLGDVMNQRIEKPTEIMLPTRIVIRNSCRKI